MDDSLRQLLDERAIVAVQVRYAVTLDAGDWAGFRSCFTPDAVVEFAGLATCTGYDEVEQLCRNALEPLTHSHHLLGNHTVDVHGDEATAGCYLQAQHTRDGLDGGANFIVAGVYADRFVRTGDGWRIAHRRLDTWWTEGNPSVLGH